MNMFKKNGGFTLVELIVVIAILAILAGVAIPTYSGYISKANEAADMTLLDSVKTAVIFDVTDQDPTATVKTITVAETAADATSVVVNVTTSVATITTADITDYVDAIDFKSNNTSYTLDLTAPQPKWTPAN